MMKIIKFRQKRAFLLLPIFIAVMASIAPVVKAMPSFARQTGEPCRVCHTQAFGPNLTPFGRDFKLGGYTLQGGSGMAAELPPVSAMIQGSFTNTSKDQPPSVTPSGHAPGGFNNNNNFTFDQAAVFYAGRIAGRVGAFSQLTYNGYTDRLALDNTDIRFADQFTPGGNQVIYGISLNNSPTVQDLWNTTPVWGFPYLKSAVQPAIGAVALIDGALSGQVGGATAYTMINNMLYLEAGGYASLANTIQKGVGVANAGQQEIDGAAPYWRVAVQRDWKGHFFEMGHYGMIADVFPGRNSSNGVDHYTDVAVDVAYQFMGYTRHIFETKTTYIYEARKLTASQLAGNAGFVGDAYLTTFKFNTAYTFDQTYGITFAYNKTAGSADPVLYSAYGSTRPNSEFYTVELVYVPFGKSVLHLQMLNLRASLQYIAYSAFNGLSSQAGDNNTFMVNGMLAF
ncbi:MAG: cytochrome C [Methylococcales bacterium]|nr:cytochrome C [Methylococcales bacterium]